MADVTISELDELTPLGQLYVPITNGNNTGRAQLSSLQVDYTSITGKPETGMQVFISNSTWTVPQYTTKIKVTCIGGGGGAGGNSTRGSFSGSGGAGGGGGASIGYLTVIPGSSISVTIGTGGTSGGSLGSGGTAAAGTTGGATTVGIITANGGGGGSGGFSSATSASNGSPGSLGSSSGGSLNLSGLYGSNTSLALGNYGSGATSNATSGRPGLVILEW